MVETTRTHPDHEETEARPADPGPGGAMGRVRRLYDAHNNKVWTLGDQVMVSGVNFLTIAAIARPLGPDGFGVFFWAYIVFLFFKAIHIAVIVSPMMSIGPKQEPAQEPGYFGTVMVHQAGLALVTALTVPLILGLFASIDAGMDVRDLALPLIAATLGDQVQDSLRRYLFTKGRPLAAFANDVVTYLVRVALLFALPMVAGITITGALALWIMAATSFGAVLVGLPWIDPVRFDRASMTRVSRSHWNSSKWLFGMGVLQFCSGHAIVQVAGIVLGPATVGGIRSTLNILAPIQVITLALQNIAPQHASRVYKAEGPEALTRFLLKLAGAGLVVSLGIAIAGWLFAEPIVRLLYGEDFVPYAYLINWWVIILTVRFLQFPLEVGLRSLEYTRPLFITVAIEAVFGLSSAYFLAQHFGIAGTMCGLVVAHIIPVTVLTILFLKRVRDEQAGRIAQAGDRAQSEPGLGQAGTTA